MIVLKRMCRLHILFGSCRVFCGGTTSKSELWDKTVDPLTPSPRSIMHLPLGFKVQILHHIDT